MARLLTAIVAGDVALAEVLVQQSARLARTSPPVACPNLSLNHLKLSRSIIATRTTGISAPRRCRTLTTDETFSFARWASAVCPGGTVVGSGRRRVQ